MGETVRSRSATDGPQLMAQQSQIARVAIEGQSNHEIAAQLFLSPRTVQSRNPLAVVLD